MIYVIEERDFDGAPTGFVKIGFTSASDEADADAAKKRISSIQTGNPRPVVIIGACAGDRKLEKALHAAFAEERLRRPNLGEWFRMSERLAAWVATVRITDVHAEPTEPRKPSYGCSRCGVVGHNVRRCPESPRQTKATFEVVVRRPATWTWRGKPRYE